MVSELETLGAPYNAWVLEDLAPRPLENLPQEILDDLETCQVSIFAVQAQRNELRTRTELHGVRGQREIRFARDARIAPATQRDRDTRKLRHITRRRKPRIEAANRQ